MNKECICAEINARHCPIHNETPLNPNIQQHLDKFDKQFERDNSGEKVEGYLLMNSGKWVKGDDREWCKIATPHDVKLFLEQALQSTWNAAVKDTVERTRLKDKGINPLFREICSGYRLAVEDQNELINKLI